MRALRHYLLPAALTAFVTAPATSLAATIFEIMDDVTVFADSLQGKAGNFLDQNFDPNDLTNYISNSAIESVITGQNPATFAWSPDFHLSQAPATWLDLGFGTEIYNGDGYDLAFFFTGNGTNLSTGFAPYRFTLDVGADGSSELLDQGVTSSTTTFNNGAYVASYALIDLDSLGFDTVTPLGDIRIHLGDRSMPVLSMAGAFHTSATMSPAPTVPLPPSVWLFTSALAMLGVIARRKHG